MSATTANRRPQRVPVGSLIVVGPPGSGKTTLLREQLRTAGLPTGRVVCRDDLRSHFGQACPDLAHRIAPATCMHFETEVNQQVAAAALAFLVEGKSWMYDQTGSHEERLRVEVDRAHAQGLAAVALRRRGNDGSQDITLEHCEQMNASRDRKVPAAVLRSLWEAYTKVTPERLYEIGFDVVLEWDEHTTFELMPEGVDARNLTGDLAVIGDIHGCADTFLHRMLPALGTDERLSNPDITIVSVGDINDKGQHSVEMIRWWLWALRTGRALLTDSNHNKALVRALTRPELPVRFGLAETLAQIDAQPDAEQLKQQIIASFSRLPNHLVFRDHVVVHAALTESRLFRTDPKTRSFAVHTRFNKDPWHWTGTQTLIHGHVVVGQPTRRRAPVSPERPGHVPGEVIALDTGAYSGGGLSAYLTRSDTTVTVPSVATDQIDPSVAARLRAELIAAGVITETQPAASSVA